MASASTQYTPNNFNFDFLDPNKNKKPSFTPSNTLRFGECLDAIDQSVVKNKRITYSLEGSQLTRLTNESNLHEKIFSYNEEVKKQTVIEIDSENKEEEKEGEEQKKVEEKKLRYFMSLDEVTERMKCRRCGEYGHYQRSCTISVKESCFYCMGRHHFLECQQSTCHRCNEEGHKAKDCPFSNGKCYKCDKYGHKESNCVSLVLYEDLKNGDFETKDLKRMRCLNCCERGHVNCTIPKKDNLYAGYSQGEVESKKKPHSKSKYQDVESEEEQGLQFQSMKKRENRRDGFSRDYQRDNRKNNDFDRYERREFKRYQDQGGDRRGSKGKRGEEYSRDYNREKEHHVPKSSYRSISKIQREFQEFEKERSRDEKRGRRQDQRELERNRNYEREQNRFVSGYNGRNQGYSNNRYDNRNEGRYQNRNESRYQNRHQNRYQNRYQERVQPTKSKSKVGNKKCPIVIL